MYFKQARLKLLNGYIYLTFTKCILTVFSSLFTRPTHFLHHTWRLYRPSGNCNFYATFGVSKKAYKQAIGSLYKDKKIVISEHGIMLVPQS